MGDVLIRRRRLVVVCLALAWPIAGLVACGAILGIEDKPLRTEADTSSSLADAMDVATDAGADGQCRRLESLGCSDACPHDFCDDFDRDAALASGWSAPVGFANPLLRGDSGFVLGAPGNSQPIGLVATTDTAGSTSYGILGHQLVFAEGHPNQTFDGVRVALDLRVEALAFTGVGGPVKDAGSSTMLGFIRPDSPKGLAVLLTDQSVHLDVSADVFGGGAELVATINDNLKISTVLGTWVRIELFLGNQERAVREGYEKCRALAPGLVAVAALGGGVLGEACVAVPPAIGDGKVTWAEAPALLVGGLLFAPGNATFRIDNVVADFYAK